MGGGVQFHLVHLGVVLVVHLGGGWGRPVSPCTFGGSTSNPFGGWGWRHPVSPCTFGDSTSSTFGRGGGPILVL